ncbi:MAG: hypothetical protein JWP89_1754 [Schlesneria sp.]|nr:hypothetical protein [Schlesneria sp.]
MGLIPGPKGPGWAKVRPLGPEDGHQEPTQTDRDVAKSHANSLDSLNQTLGCFILAGQQPELTAS